MKPHLKKVSNGWLCMGQGYVVVDSTPKLAYKTWLAGFYNSRFTHKGLKGFKNE